MMGQKTEDRRQKTEVGPVDGDFESLKQAAKDRIAKGDLAGLNPHKVLRLCAEFEQLKNNNRWIPVGERMPKSPTQYLCCDMKPNSSELPSVYVATTWSKADDFFAENAYGNYDLRVYPTHWKRIILPIPGCRELPELSETHVIDGEQATAPVPEQTLSEGIRLRVIRSLTWLVTDAKHRSDDCRNNLEDGSEGGYSPELTEAGELLNELKNNTVADKDDRHHDEDTLAAVYQKGFEDAKKVILQEVQKLGK